MGICIAGKPALDWWFGEGRSHIGERFVPLMRAKMLVPTRPERDIAFKRFAPDGALEIIVSRQTDRSRRTNCVEHCYLDLGKCKLFCQIGDFTQVCAPELALLQVLRNMDDVAWILLASRAFSSYGGDDLQCVSPLTSPDRCAAVAKSVSHCCNAKRALYLLDKCVSGAASPREIQVALLLTIPRRMGGYGLPKPELNGEVPLSASQAAEMGVSSLRGDAVWRKQKVIVEYESDLHHASAYQLGVDSRRRAIFRNKGYCVHTVTNNQVVYANETDRLVEAVSRDLGYRARSLPADYEHRKALLRRAVLESIYL